MHTRMRAICPASLSYEDPRRVRRLRECKFRPCRREREKFAKRKRETRGERLQCTREISYIYIYVGEKSFWERCPQVFKSEENPI